MLVSIIIPVYKSEKYIEKCVDSVLSQTYRQLEVIFVDDYSPDHSMRLAKDFIRYSSKSQDIQFKFIKHDCNRGAAAARNSGIKIATGEYIFLLDSDDEITHECVESFVHGSDGGNVDVVFAGNKEVRGNNSCDLSYPHDFYIKGSLEIIKAFVNGQIAIIAGNKFVRRSIFVERGVWFKEGVMYEDELWTFLLVNQISSYRYLSKVTYIYNIHPGSVMTGSITKKRIDSLMTIAEEMAQLVNHGRILQCEENIDYIQHKRLIWLSTIIRSKITWKEKWAYFLRFYSLPIGNNIRFLWNFTTSQMTNLLYPYRRNVSLWIRKKFSS